MSSLSELEGCLDYTTPVRGVTNKTLVVTTVDDSRSDADVIRHLILVEEFKQSGLLKVLTRRSLTHSNTSRVTINKYIIPSQTSKPGLTVCSSTFSATYSIPTVTTRDRGAPNQIEWVASMRLQHNR
jgi:hypothetical protein